MNTTCSSEFKEYLSSKQELIESALQGFLSGDDPDLLWQAMRYSVLNGGKRLRAILCLAAAQAIANQNDTQEKVLPLACAIEMVHAMSLIHDDLPAMDNDDLRRGKPTNHKVFGEAIALLAGDALLVYANEVLIKHTPQVVPPTTVLELSAGLSKAIGPQGMVGGQVIDIALTGQGDSPGNQESILAVLHARKTGALISFSAWSGAMLAGASKAQVEVLKNFGDILGLSFQIADDILDITGSAQDLGKTPGKDNKNNKVTWVSTYGMDACREKLAILYNDGLACLNELSSSNDNFKVLSGLLDYAIHRKN